MTTVRIHLAKGAPDYLWAICEYEDGVLIAEHHAPTAQISFPEPVVVRLMTTPARATVEFEATVTRDEDGMLVISPESCRGCPGSQS